ncbi:helix-turn-helix domain-containing protein [Neptunomonas antarctica]|uniref:Putative DNA-binding domain-containing protein n=1 Tax=Neptunomonas antarctica TaxID=619304 RepID=A0A1N7M8L6_9GAMM|nr:ATP-binding protein [Neptunomonas antarctica]SIS82455.1 Putative DNA-binding domain-containing protein [Neptunomonas antarctica]
MSLSKQQHEGFAQFFEKPTRESLRTLLKDNIGETDYLDFKEIWVPFPKLSKHILALSNSGGGAIIVGVKENEDGTATSVGLDEFQDKEKISKGVAKHLPTDVSWDVFSFTYEESEYGALKGKKFQVLLVEYIAQSIPFLCLKAGDGLTDNTVYVRRGTSTTEATHDDLQKIINERIETGYSSTHVMALSEHLQQLKELYRTQEGSNSFTAAARFRAMIEGDKFKDYHDFVSDLIEKKKVKIEHELEL